jgi:hypothetical protein
MQCKFWEICLEVPLSASIMLASEIRDNEELPGRDVKTTLCLFIYLISVV